MKYVIGFLIFILVIIVGLTLIFGRGKKTPSTTKAPVVLALPDYASTDATVGITTDGLINGDDAHRAIRITVSRDARTIDIIQGYSGRVIDSHTYPNTYDAYSTFLRALNYQGFNIKTKGSKVSNDPAGYCPTGTRTTFSLDKGGDNLSALWTSTCGVGNFGGNADLIITLFHDQITDYGNLTANVSLGD